MIESKHGNEEFNEEFDTLNISFAPLVVRLRGNTPDKRNKLQVFIGALSR